MASDKFPFIPARGLDANIRKQEPKAGMVWFATDTRKIYYSNGEELLLMGGSSGVFYGNFDTTVNDIYNEVYGYDIPNDNISLQERILLEKACGEKQGHYKLIQELLALQKNKVLLMKKQGLQNDLEARIDAFIKEQ